MPSHLMNEIWFDFFVFQELSDLVHYQISMIVEKDHEVRVRAIK